MKLQEAVGVCKNSGLQGVELIEFAQRLVNSNMTYSYSNSFEFPSRAFERGMGYCWHQASALNRILRALGASSRMVYAVKTVIPPREHEGRIVGEHISGHVWCRVRFEGEERDVCPGNPDNRFGTVHFTPLSKVKNWNRWICFWAYWGSAWVNAGRRKKLQA